MTTENFANQPAGTVSSGGTTAPASGTTETWTVSSTTMPAASTGSTQFHVCDTATGKTGEIILVTNVSGTTWSVTRGAEGTAPVAHTAGFGIVQVVTAGFLNGVASGGTEPWQFRVSDYGAKGDGQVVTDGAITTGTGNLACATSTPFASAAHGMAIHVGGAGGGTYTPLCTTINTVTDSGHVVLTSNATSTVSSAIVYFGTDDTAAVQSAVNAATTYAQANHGYAEVLFDPKMYIIGGAPVVGGSTKGNAQITLPLISSTAQKVTLVFKGTGEQTTLNHWLQTTPQASGAVLACANNTGTNDVTNGPSFVVGGPVATYGGATSTFTNLLATVDGVSILVPYNGTIGGWGFYGLAEANVLDSSVMAAGVPPASSSVPKLSDPTNISNQFPVGLQMPDVNNNDNCDILRYSCEGVCIGLMMSEHTWFGSIRLIYCVAGIQCGSWSGTSMPHTCGGDHASVEVCGTALVGLKATSNVYINRFDLESANAVFESSTFLQGQVGFGYNGTSTWGTLTVSGGSALRILDLRQPSGPVSSPHAAPSSGSAWANLYYRDAWITLHMSAGTVTALNIDSAAQNITAAANVTFLLPAGHSYTPTYSGGTLSHTVTLL